MSHVPTIVPAHPTEPPLAVGEIVGGCYEIVALRGVGGMGAVYEARDRVLGRSVAMKVPLGEHGTRALRMEARALAALHHPSLVTVHAAGVHRGVDYVVMELLHGRTLEHRIVEAARARESIAIDEAVGLLMAIADGLSVLHGAGMAHRDLKPGNVILSGARAVLIDLGLFVPEFATQDEAGIACSPEYVAPEVLMRNVAPGAGPLVDLYSLGILAFELLTGRSPFYDANVAKIVARQVCSPPPDVRTLRPETPPKLAALITELLAKDPTERPPSSEAVLWRLGALATHVLGRPMRVDIIDDDADVGEVLSRALGEMLPGLTVRSFVDPREALAAIERDAPDVVAVDLHMPYLNGVETCMRLASMGRPAPVIVAMSAEANPQDARVLRALGAVRVVPKDYRFVAAVCDVIRSIRRARDLPPPSLRPSIRPQEGPRG